MDPRQFNPLTAQISAHHNDADTLAALDAARQRLPQSLTPDQERAALEVLTGGPVHAKCLSGARVSPRVLGARVFPRASMAREDARAPIGVCHA
jgi:hypothetical protein